jgi:FkbM family methyltransferase
MLISDLFKLRVEKLLFGLSHAACWPALIRGSAPSVEHYEAVRNLNVDLILDVGANRGQFSLLCLHVCPGIPIHAYEPLNQEAAIYRSLSSEWSNVHCHEFALGASDNTQSMHVSGRADSSSLLPIGDLQQELYPATREVGARNVRVVALDSLPEHWSGAKRALLKIDVQGYELNVLKGARKALKHMAYIYVECSEVELYAGQALRPEVQAFLEENGFRLERRHNEQWHKGQLVQADYLFCRASG